MRLRNRETIASSRGRQARLRAVAAGALLIGLLAGCTVPIGVGTGPTTATTSGSATSGSRADWVPFGPFQKPARFADDPGITGPGRIRVPNVGVVHVDAKALLPEADIESEKYTYTFNERTPIIVGVIQVRQLVHYRRHTETIHLTRVLGISAEREPRVLTNFRVFRGAPHTVSLTGLSDLGVVVIFLEGELVPGEPGGTRLEGIDAARGTDVWRRDGGYPGPGTNPATFYTATARDACAEKIEEYEIAGGVTTRSQEFPNRDVSAGGTCRVANE